MKRKARKVSLNEKAIRLGRYSFKPTSNKIIDIWEEGEEFIKLRSKLKEIAGQKQELEKLKKKINSIKRKEAKEINQNRLEENLNNNYEAMMNNINNVSIPDEIESELNDQKELIGFKISLLNKV